MKTIKVMFLRRVIESVTMALLLVMSFITVSSCTVIAADKLLSSSSSFRLIRSSPSIPFLRKNQQNDKVRSSFLQDVVFLPRGGAEENSDKKEEKDQGVPLSSSKKKKKKVLILDVDNTLYNEQSLPNPKIEYQIINNTHLFAKQYGGYTKEEADEFYHKFGSTIEGMRHDLLLKQDEKNGKEKVEEEKKLLHEFYTQVYQSVDTSPLLLQQQQSFDTSSDNTGYSHTSSSSYLSPAVLNFLQNSPYPIYLASNSPHFHIQKILSILGLDEKLFAGVLTPDSPLVHSAKDDNNNKKEEENVVYFPTKSKYAKQFYSTILSKYPTTENDVVLIDDSIQSILGAQQVGIRGIHLLHDDKQNGNDEENICTSLEDALTSFLLSSSSSHQKDEDETYKFSQVKYLQSKNIVDGKSINVHVWKTLALQLARNVYLEGEKEDVVLKIADVGAGVLSMLQFMMHGSDDSPTSTEEDETKKEKLVPLFDLVLEELTTLQDNDNNDNGDKKRNQKIIKQVHYDAYESNAQLMGGCRQTLQKLGFVQVAGGTNAKTEEVTDEEKNKSPIAIFQRHPNSSSSSSSSCKKAQQRPSESLNIIVRLFLQDFTIATATSSSMIQSQDVATKNEKDSSPHLVVGCCLADLFDPTDLALSVLRFAHLLPKAHPTLTNSSTSSKKTNGSSALIYFPITFAGTTRFHPPKPFEIASSLTSSDDKLKCKVIPSDTTAFRFYSHLLSTKYQHNLDPSSLILAMKKYNFELCTSGSSNWNIHPLSNSYLWSTMIYFFKSTGLILELIKNGWNGVGWFEQIFSSGKLPAISVSNVDLLFRYNSASVDSISSPLLLLPKQEQTQNHDENQNENISSTIKEKEVKVVDEIQFISPRNVTKITKRWNIVTDDKNRKDVHLQDQNKQEEEEDKCLGPNQVEVQSICSLISSGTELKIFRGTFDNDSDAALDVNIKGMADSSMSYPLSYGYSLVGRVRKCGAAVSDADDLCGRLVFTFSPHSSRIIADRESLHVVPDGISAEDAIFFPSVETALSLVHDAHVRIGERVAVFGQGLIGLLVTSILGMQEIASSKRGGEKNTIVAPTTSGRFGTVSVFDTIGDRLAAASEMGASEALLPSEIHATGPFDVAIEVSGNARALQSAIDSTSPGGRIIIGSWYGNQDVRLKLGIDFHRSRKTIKASQVSEIPPELRCLWTKERRFALTWDIMKLIRPSRLITKTVTLDESQEAYELLDQGKEIAIAFHY